MRAQPNAHTATPRRAKRQVEAGKSLVTPAAAVPAEPPCDQDMAPDEAVDVAFGEFGAADERVAESVETLAELEREIGISDWIDPQTGEPAEGQSPPHLDDE